MTERSEALPKVGIVGIGIMGTAMTERLLASGLRPSIFDTVTEKTAPFADRGAMIESSPAALAEASDIVILSLPNAAVVNAVVFDDHGIASRGSPEKILVDMSSIDPAETRNMAERLQASCGMRWLDAPLSGGAPGALAGKLAVMAGGTEEDFETVKPVMSHLARRFTLMGSVGAGQATKCVNQIIAGCAFVALAEASALARDGNIEADKLLEALSGGRADSNLLQEFLPMMLSGDYAATGTIRSMVKDFANIEAFAAASGTPLPMTHVAADIHRILLRQGQGEAPNAAIVEYYRSR